MPGKRTSTVDGSRAGDFMSEARLVDKRWSIDLERRIQEEHYRDSASYDERYGFNPDSGKELFVIDKIGRASCRDRV